jgi:hypothetical protein
MILAVSQSDGGNGPWRDGAGAVFSNAIDAIADASSFAVFVVRIFYDVCRRKFCWVLTRAGKRISVRPTKGADGISIA